VGVGTVVVDRCCRRVLAVMATSVNAAGAVGRGRRVRHRGHGSEGPTTHELQSADRVQIRRLQRHTRKILHGTSDDAWPGQGIIDPNPSGHHADERMVLVAW
jgi:hypothetical protein